MTATEMQRFKDRLVHLKDRLGDELTALEGEALRGVGGEPSGNLSNVPVHPADLSADNYEEEVALSLLQNKEEFKVEIQNALNRIEYGTYGKCESCNRAIARERLEAVPYVRHCVSCAEKLQEAAVAHR